MLHPDLIALENHFQPSILTPIHADFLSEKNIELWLKRDDLLHPIISGNKWRKLKYSLNHALSLEKTTLVSMGGAYSNHLHALAFVGKCLNLKTKAFIRGEKPVILNSTLQDLLAWNMALEFVSREEYRTLRNFKSHDTFPDLKNDGYWIPEGGYLPFALQGVGECIAEIQSDYDVICTACGTGTTLAGLINAVPKQKKVIGFAALKGADFLIDEVTNLLPNADLSKNWQINLDYHFGGFAKKTPSLLQFIADFEQHHHVSLEPIYTGKLLFGLFELIQRDFFPAGTKIIALHTGGLQGKRGFEFSNKLNF